MTDYIGIKCISCGEEFNKDDDIVVCPDCGTPYHRECYKKEGHCINTNLHEVGGSFRSTYEEALEINRCPRCGANIEPLALFCDKCGMPLSMSDQNLYGNEYETQDNQGVFGGGFSTQSFQINFSDPLCGLNPEEDYEGVKLKDLAAFVGNNTFYYIPMFKRIKESKHKLTWNFAAMLAPTSYYAYRKMYVLMVICFLLRFFIYIPSLIVFLSSSNLGNSVLIDLVKSFDLKSGYFEMVSNISYALSYVIMFATGAFSNWFYYRHAINKIKSLKENGKSSIAAIKAKGGVSQLSLILLYISPFIFVGILFLITMIVSIFTQ